MSSVPRESGSAPVPGAAEVRHVAALPNPVIRNLRITHCYARLAAALADRTGEGANWCTYATWASRQAGSTIRGEDLVGRLERRLGASHWLLHPIATVWRRLLRRGLFQPQTRLGRLTAELHTPFDAFERASEAVARGNLKVFEEIGLEFARYLELPAGDGAAFERFLGDLREGDPPEGQGYLRRAFARYERRGREADRRMRAQLAVLANLEIGLHEQTRLQPEIREALDAAYTTNEDLGERALRALFPSVERWWALVRLPAAGLVGVFATGAQRASSRVAREVVTASFMTLSLPGRVLSLGKHLPDEYPEELGDPHDRELTELLDRFEPSGAACRHCGARDWSELDQRMHYIVHLFSAFHLDPDLAQPPFTPEQVEAFGRGVVPDGRL